ncbi:Alpha-monoglucosyldiacylglycerol synthase [Candidatus Izimaplasma bacterium HR1]|jgi:1,2-diacylglycerol 3-alpha-glucosyltransferase|uniref:glycosyltransferase n=1 Tax=Candidatus Izimoplasma sp. HR1 TaxID=1541959 RepID=UPI0004F74B3F|nr:Alpha-monoglucosyldiacylglycerol synthase [Candidatus Izimaplasma bacterium HR1]
MRIGLFTDAYFPIISGVTISVRTLRDELEKLGHEVFIISNNHDNAEEERNVVRTGGRKLPMKEMGEFRVGRVTKNKVKDIGTLNLDIVHCHTEFTMGRLGRKVARRYNLPVVHTYHTMYVEYIHFISKLFRRPLRFISKIYSRRFADSADVVIFPTIKVKRTFDDYGYKKKSYIIPSGIYLERFDKNSFPQNEIIQLKEKLGIRHDEYVMLFLGRISREKSIEELIIEFAKVKNPKAKLVIVGGGPDLEFFRSVSIKLGIEDKVIFTGMIDPLEIGIYYQLADLFVNFSMSETQGLTYYEALASCVPLLVKYDSNLEGIILNGENGYSFTDDNEFSVLADKIIKDKKLQAYFIEKSCATVQKFSAKNYAISVEEIYKKVFKG